MKIINLLLALLLVVFLAGCVQSSQQNTIENGRAVFLITDAAADMGTVTSVKITVDSVSAHSQTEGWVTVSSTPKTYDLLQLKAEGSKVLLADVTLKDGDYEQVRLDVSKVVVTDAQGEHEAKLPSGELKIVGNFSVKPNMTAAVTFDFIADESLHITGNGKYIFAPVVQLETHENADVEIKADSKVEIKSGNVKTNIKVGMDLDGNVGLGLGIPKNEDIIDVDGKLKLVIAQKVDKLTGKVIVEDLSTEDNGDGGITGISGYSVVYK